VKAEDVAVKLAEGGCLVELALALLLRQLCRFARTAQVAHAWLRRSRSAGVAGYGYGFWALVRLREVGIVLSGSGRIWGRAVLRGIGKGQLGTVGMEWPVRVAEEDALTQYTLPVVEREGNVHHFLCY
jgi:hypothetical protein